MPIDNRMRPRIGRTRKCSQNREFFECEVVRHTKRLAALAHEDDMNERDEELEDEQVWDYEVSIKNK